MPPPSAWPRRQKSMRGGTGLGIWGEGGKVKRMFQELTATLKLMRAELPAANNSSHTRTQLIQLDFIPSKQNQKDKIYSNKDIILVRTLVFD